MAFSVKTNEGHSYSYLRLSNEIVEGNVSENIQPLHFNQRELISEFPNLSVFTIALTHQCNLRCTYCCYSGAYRNTRTHESLSFSSFDVDKILDFIDRYKRKMPVTVSFYGGECLLKFDLIKCITTSAQKRWKEQVQFEISTNGTLISREVAKWLVDNNVILFISLDGTSDFQDRQRRTIDGKGTFEAIRKSLLFFSEYYPDYFEDKISLMMTLVDVKEIQSIAVEWNQDGLLRRKLPIRISSVFPNYEKGVERDNFEDLLCVYLGILDFYEANKHLALLRSFFERFLAEWIERPIFNIDEPVNYPTCVPNNTKLYIDTDGKIGICEKLPDLYRVGSLEDGINWKKVNEVADKMVGIVSRRCVSCPVARLCDICPNILDLSEEEMDIYCHNQKVLHNVKLRIFCELAEKGLI